MNKASEPAKKRPAESEWPRVLASTRWPPGAPARFGTRYRVWSPDTVGEIRREIISRLRAIAASESDLDASALIVTELLGNVFKHARGIAWIDVDCSGAKPVIYVYDTDGPFELPRGNLEAAAVESGRGLLLVQALAHDVKVSHVEGKGNWVSATLPVNLRAA